jgi:glycosyltransferase involved in cell wall biosynthesis
VIILLSLSAVIQLIFHLSCIFRLRSYHKKEKVSVVSPVSVIICARNEEENLKKHLPSILEQKHENFEVVVVNDCSTDDTEDVLGEFLKKYKNLRTTTIAPDRKFTHGKKLAITVGIKAARNEWLVFTDADCQVESEQWLNQLQSNFTESTDIVLGYGGYKQRKGLLNRYIRYDTVLIAVQYLSMAIAGKPYMGVGRNLAYRRSLFFRKKGFASHYNLLSGDDDLFVNENATGSNTTVELHPESFTRSEPCINWREYFLQKKRHFTTATRYKAKQIFILGLEPLTRLVFYLTFVYLLCLNIFFIPTLVTGGLRILIFFLLFRFAARRFQEKNLLVWIIIFDIISLFINFNVYLSTAFRSKKSRWK